MSLPCCTYGRSPFGDQNVDPERARGRCAGAWRGAEVALSALTLCQHVRHASEAQPRLKLCTALVHAECSLAACWLVQLDTHPHSLAWQAVPRTVVHLASAGAVCRLQPRYHQRKHCHPSRVCHDGVQHLTQLQELCQHGLPQPIHLHDGVASSSWGRRRFEQGHCTSVLHGAARGSRARAEH